MEITVAGLGYVGLTTAVCLAEMGNNVIGIDNDSEKVRRLLAGIPTFYENKLEELLTRNLNNNRLTFTCDEKYAYKNSSIIFICVGTPNNSLGTPELASLKKVIDDIIENIENNKIVVIKSTVPVGTGDEIERYIENKLNKNRKIEIVSNPEFLSQGTAIDDMMEASRVVLGISNDKVKSVLSQIYEKFESPLFFTDRCSAEMIKYASNSFLALKISYINEIANLCEGVNANIEDVVKGMSYDDRIGSKFLRPGIGYGGACFPKDTKAFVNLANDSGYHLNIINQVTKVNDIQNFILLKKAKKYYKSFENLKVAILGLAFKPNTDDLREAPALKNIEVLLNNGAVISAYDPKAISNSKKIYSQIKYCTDIEETIKDAEICFIFTEWSEICKFDISKFAQLMRNAIVIDGRNCYDTNLMREANVVYESIGRR